MESEMVLYIMRRALETALLVSAPILGVMLAVSIIVSILQAVTSIRDQTIGVVIKLGCLGASVLLFGGWMMEMAMSFTKEIFNGLESLGP